jgi:cystathionine beta-lyase/cystathionine gamma-synthase
MNAKPEYIVRFIARDFPDRSDSVYKELLVTDISVGITAELAEKSDNLFSTHAEVPSLHVYIAPEIFEKFLFTETGTNYTAQTVDVLKLLECWEELGFPLCIDTTKFNFYKGWAIGFDVKTGSPKNL